MNRYLSLLVALIASPLFAAEPTKPLAEVSKQLNIAYNSAQDADPVRHKLDAYLPKDAKNFPMMMFVHGGTWRSGSKDLYAALGETFAKQGIGVIIINYRLSRADNNFKHPDHVKDVAKAFGWMKSNAEKMGGDVKKLYLAGHSAGGHLISLLATDHQYLKAEKCEVKDIRGVMSISGVYTIPSYIPAFQLPFGKDEEMCKAASPVTHVKSELPPFFVAYGDSDFPTLDTMAIDFTKKLKESKNNVKLVKMEKRDHYSIIIKLATSADDPLTKEMISFVSGK